MAAMTESTVNRDWMRVAHDFSNADLRPHASTEAVMSYFSDDAVFSQPGRYENIGKRTAWVAFKVLCETGVSEYYNTSEPEFEQEGDHVVWKFFSVQLRKKDFSEWIFGPQWYRIDNVSHLYFTGEGEDCKISRYVTVQVELDHITEEEAHSKISSRVGV